MLGTLKRIKTWWLEQQNKNLQGVIGCIAGRPTFTTTSQQQSTIPHTNLQTINRNSRNPSLIWLAPQVVTSCLQTGYWGPQRRNGIFILSGTMGNCSGPKSRRLFLSLPPLFLAMAGGKSELHSSRQWGLLSLRLCTEMGAIRNSPCLSSHDSMSALCDSVRAVRFLSIHVIHRRERPNYADDWRPAFTHPTRQHTAELRIHWTHNCMACHTERRFSWAWMFEVSNGHPPITEIS